MIVVRVELWPGGNPNAKVDLGAATISNVSSLAPISAYHVRLLKGAAYSRRPGEVWREGEVAAFPRADKRFGPWELIALGLEATVGDQVARLKRYLTTIKPAEPQLALCRECVLYPAEPPSGLCGARQAITAVEENHA